MTRIFSLSHSRVVGGDVCEYFCRSGLLFGFASEITCLHATRLSSFDAIAVKLHSVQIQKFSVHNALIAYVPRSMNTKTIRQEMLKRKLLLKIPAAFPLPTQQCVVYSVHVLVFLFVPWKVLGNEYPRNIHSHRNFSLLPMENIFHFSPSAIYIDRKAIKWK